MDKCDSFECIYEAKCSKYKESKDCSKCNGFGRCDLCTVWMDACTGSIERMDGKPEVPHA